MRLGFLFSVALAAAGCGPPDVHRIARDDDARFGTRIFTWLVDHEPSAVVVWHAPAGIVRTLLPGSRVDTAGATKVCAQAARAHALLLLIEPRTAARDRNEAEDCGFALDRDGGAIVVAPR